MKGREEGSERGEEVQAFLGEKEAPPSSKICYPVPILPPV